MGGDQRLLGRDEPLRRLRAALTASAAGRGRIVLVTGEPGIGKSALLAALSDDAADRAITAVWGRCWNDAMAPSFWPWIQVLRQIGDRPDAQRLGRLVATADPDGEPADRFDLFDGVASLLVDAAALGGLVVVLDDLQWADDASLKLLQFLGRHLGPARILIAGGLRDAPASMALTPVVTASEVIALERLTDAAAADVVGAVAGALPSADVADVVRRAGGNPLFIRELARLVASGSAGATAAEGHRLGSIEDVVAERLASLSARCRRMLDAAAVLGAGVRLDVLAHTVGGGHDLGELVTEAVLAGVLVAPVDWASPPVFVHDVFREVVTARIPVRERARLHIMTGRLLDERRSAGAQITSAAVAAQFVSAASLGAADAVADAVRQSRAAAADATDQFAFEDAAAHLGRALSIIEAAEPPDPATRLELLLDLGAALDKAGDASGARRALIEAADLARSRHDVEAFAVAAAGVHQLGALSGLARDATIALLEEAAAELGDDDSPLLARVEASLARELHHAWEQTFGERARRLARSAVDRARRLADPATLAFCLLAQHDAWWEVGSAVERLPIVTEMLALADDARDPELRAQARLLSAAARMELGDPDALGELERYCRAAEALGHARSRWGALSRRAVLALLAGQFDRAVELCDEAARLGADIGEPDAPGVRDTLLWELARFGEGWGGFGTDAHWVPSGTWPPLRALLFTARGDLDAGRATLQGFSPEHDRRHGVPRHDGWMPMIAAEAVVAAGSPDQRAAVYDWLHPYAGSHLVYGGCMGYGGAVDHYLGVLARSLGREPHARAHLEAAVAMHERLGAVAWAALDRSLIGGPPVEVRSKVGEHAPINALRREGDGWRVTFRGRSSFIRHVKGMRDLAILLRGPGKEVAALELMGGADVGRAPGPVIDDVARRQYRARIGELEVEIEQCRTDNDWGRAERAEAELDALVEQLAQAFGLGGRDRAAGAAHERARAAVTHRVRSAIRRIEDIDPELGRHLRNAVKTGSWFAYRPDTAIEWSVDGADGPGVHR